MKELFYTELGCEGRFRGDSVKNLSLQLRILYYTISNCILEPSYFHFDYA